MSATLIKKISPATVAKKKLVRLDVQGSPDFGTEKQVYDLFGFVTGYTTSKPDAERPWVRFKGEFEAVTPDGEIFRSGSAFIQQPIEDMLLSALARQKDAEGGDVSVQIAIRLSIVPPSNPNKVSATGYEFKVISLMETKDTPSPLQSLRDQAKAAIAELDQKRLAAPTPEPAKHTKK